MKKPLRVAVRQPHAHGRYDLFVRPPLRHAARRARVTASFSSRAVTFIVVAAWSHHRRCRVVVARTPASASARDRQRNRRTETAVARHEVVAANASNRCPPPRLIFC